MSETEGDAKAPKSRGVFCDLMDLGNVLCRRGDWEKAAESFTTALTLRPDEKNGLVCRSRCYLHMGQFENALRDSEASLNDDKTFCEGLYQKAEALCRSSDWVSKKHRTTIVTCINSNTSVKLKMNEDASFLQKDEEVTRQLFGEFYSDKKYLENLLKDDGLVKSKTKGGENLQDVIRTYLKYLDTCTDHFNRKKPGKREKQSKPKCSKQRPGAPREPARFLLKSLDDIDAELTSGNAEGSLKKAKTSHGGGAEMVRESGTRQERCFGQPAQLHWERLG
ncbi:unnamed protein product [Pleuronectes platessa]|uniref:Outer dynein arm-docking complex subunit 4 n=1 Tax=Pleuronectes platessa TaxID=8262 RepID=A0A9N7YN61_PLEPL|nr:unnamed protein product [Pleuronectes platessa]